MADAKKFVYEDFGSTLEFAEDLGWVDNHPDCEDGGFDAGLADHIESEALDFIKSKGYEVEFEE